MTDARYIPTASGFAGSPSKDDAKQLFRPRQMNLRTLSFLMMLAIAVLPVSVFYSWVGRTAFDNELKRVDENHLIIAKNLSSTLSRYSADAIAVFEGALTQNSDENSYGRLLNKFDICKVLFFNEHDDLLSQVGRQQASDQEIPSSEIISELRELAISKPGETFVSGIHQTKDGPHFFIFNLLNDGRFAIAPWSSSYVQKLQKSVAFGELGHSMMVDQNGLVVAHPNPEWERVNKNASKLPVVQAMLAGETGVMQFYSPPMDADMIAGFTSVPETGWGIMVPQPIRELEVRASAIQQTALYVSALGVALAIAVGLWFSRVLTAPIVSIATSAKRVATGDLSSRVEASGIYVPSEIEHLSRTFDRMVEDIERKNEQLNYQLQIEKQLSEERAVLLAEAQRAYAMKSEFISTISHELRTPLTSIRGSVDLALSGRLGELNAKIENILNVGRRNTERLLLLVNDILDFSSLEAGQITLNGDQVSAEKMLADAIEINAPFACNTKVKLIAHPISVPFDAIVDPERIQQVFSNLISNAIKFSGNGELVELSAEKEGEFGIFRITDHGNGVPKEFRPHLFDRFTQADSADTRQVGGTGLGLAISKALVEKHGGTIDFETAIGVGTTFFFKIPLAPTPTMNR
ncbi:ATP-binding protein [Sulfitobacter mediterraneus]|uniref:ATP-binding protein n=1 Tax=Sulfitobacter mediterraneus TaxID=83219 RepID=UPI000EA3FA03|nr:ATP-binding protein [Sulfitobacter mediterraneus]